MAGQEAHIALTGLHVDATPHGKAPVGGLLQAVNVVIRSPGFVEPRPGFQVRVADDASGDDPRAMLAFGGDVLLVSKQGSAWRSNWDSDIATDVLDEDGGHLEWAETRIRGAEARDSFYVTTTDGVRTFAAGGDTVAQRAGVQRPVKITRGAALGGSPPEVISANKSVAYRATIERKDANGIITVSAPSSRLVFRNDATARGGYIMRVWLPGEVVADNSYTVRLYRTRNTSAPTPTDEELFVGSARVVAADVAAGYTQLRDETVDDDLGADLYTNESRGGLIGQNDRPPKCTDIAAYKGSLFFANITGPRRAIFRAAAYGADQTGNSTGLGYRTAAGTAAVGTPTLTGIASTTGIEPGMLLSSASTHFPQGARVTAVTASTITFDQNASGSGADSVNCHDSIAIKDVGGATTTYFVASDSEALQGELGSTGFYLYFLSDTVDDIAAPTLTAQREMVIEEIARGSGEHQLFATHADDSYAFEYGSASNDASAMGNDPILRDEMPHGLAWSKLEQPEHAPYANFVTLGSRRHQVERIVPTRDSVWVFKRDGIWKLTGAGATSGWAIKAEDTTHYLLHPETAQAMEDGNNAWVYAWTNRGVIRLNEFGLENISVGRVNSLLEGMAIQLAGYSTTTPGCFAIANQTTNEYLLAVPAALGDAGHSTDATGILVFNARSGPVGASGYAGAWTTWGFDNIGSMSHGIVAPPSSDDSSGLYWFCRSGARAIYEENPREYQGVFHHDGGEPVTISGVDNSSRVVTLAVGDAQSEGWVIRRLTRQTVVTEGLTSATSKVADPAVLSAGAATMYRPFECVIESLPLTGGNPTMLKHWQYATAVWEDLDALWAVSFAHSSSVNPSNRYTAGSTERRPIGPSAGDWTYESNIYGNHLRSPTRWLIPAEHARSEELILQIIINQAGAAWKLSGFGVGFTVMTPRTQLAPSRDGLVTPNAFVLPS